MARRRFKTMADVRRYVANVIDRLEDSELDAVAAKTRVYCAQVLASIIKDSDFELRLTALEARQNTGRVHHVQ